MTDSVQTCNWNELLEDDIIFHLGLRQHTLHLQLVEFVLDP